MSTRMASRMVSVAVLLAMCLGDLPVAGQSSGQDDWKKLIEREMIFQAFRLTSPVHKERKPRADISLPKTLDEMFKASLGFQPTPEMVDGVVDLARKTLAYVERSAPRPQLAAELKAFEKRVAEAQGRGGMDWRALYLDGRWLRRKIILSHPLLDFEKLVINRVGAASLGLVYEYACLDMGISSRPGPGPTILSPWREEPKAKTILEGKLPKGSFWPPNFDLSFDAKRLLFTFVDHTEGNHMLRCGFIYEAGVDGSGLRQITGTTGDLMETSGGRHTYLVEDTSPIYLPDGDIAFMSSRSQTSNRCLMGGASALYRAKADGTGIRQLSYGESGEWRPSLLHDGRIIYTRWDYVDRGPSIGFSVWTTGQDGTATTSFYGNNTKNPESTFNLRAVPGSDKVVGVIANSYTFFEGSLVLIDPRKGWDGEAPLTHITPETVDYVKWSPMGCYTTPWPLSEDLFLASYSPERITGCSIIPNSHAIYLVDTLGGRELIYRDPEVSSFSPMPLRPRVKPPIIPSLLNAKEKDGVFAVHNVYLIDPKIKPGTVIKRLKVMEIVYHQVYQGRPNGVGGSETLKRIVGTTPVEADGSACFRVPAGVPLMFQLLDENGLAVHRSMFQTYVHPGESLTCGSCHGSRKIGNTAPLMSEPIVGKAPRDLDPPAGPRYEGGL
ncbi:MAG: hypothetical protein HZA23_06360, partial [Nitrospirae bacterium]|nr:hypothetical protein [Nitrospirota bacterium]